MSLSRSPAGGTRLAGVRRAGVGAVLAGLLLSGCAAGTAAAGGGDDPAAACGPSTMRVTREVTPVGDVPEPKLPVTVRDAAGKSVTVRSADRILALNMYGSLAEIVYSLGLGDRMVGRDASTTFEGAGHLPLVTTNGHDLSAEAILLLRLDPTVVLADAGIGPPEAMEQLRAAGVPVVMIGDDQTLPAIGEHVTAVAAALGVPEAGKTLRAKIDKEIAAGREAATDSARPLRVAFLYLRGTAGVYLIGGKGAGSDALIEAIGATDAGTAAGLSGFRPLTSEGMINAAPDVILVLTKGLESVGGVAGLAKLPGIAQTPAGRNRRVVNADDGDLLTFGPRTGETIKALAAAVHRPCES